MPIEVRVAAANVRLRYAALLFTIIAAAVFLVARPAAGDLWAARARESAANHGVGLGYWFSWFGGTIPGHYSVIDSIAAKFIDIGVLGALATVAITPICHRLLRDTPHQLLGTWFAAVTSAFSLWSGRVPFAVGTVLMLIALLHVRADRKTLAAIFGVASALASPVSGAFLALGLTGVVIHEPKRRMVAMCAAGAAGAALVFVAFYFGVPGPQDFKWSQAGLAAAAVIVLFATRPPAYLRTVMLLALLGCFLLALIPNGMGSNFERFTWICLPVAAAATAAARTWIVIVATCLGAAAGIAGSVRDLVIAAEPISDISYYDSLNAQLDRTPGLTNYRVEVVPDGTHVAAYALLDHALLARGYETQLDNAFNAVLASEDLDATTYKLWLNNNAVGYVAINATTLKTGPEDKLVRSGTLPYLHEIWSDSRWRLFRVDAATPIAAPPARVVVAEQARLVISTSQAATVPLRVRWSRFLQIRGPGEPTLTPDGQGWTTLYAPRPGRYILS